VDEADEIGRWLIVGHDGAITVFTGKVEVGQGIRTSLAQAVADELRVPLERVSLVMGDTGRTPYDAGTFGSQTTPTMALRLRRVAATTRSVLLAMAAARWDVQQSSLRLADGRVWHADSGRSLAFEDLIGGEHLTAPVDPAVPITPAGQWAVAGRPAPKVGGRALVTGAHRYPSDLHMPGMLYGKILRPPGPAARLVTLETRAAEAIPGVSVVQVGALVGVVAPHPHTAAQALAALQATWDGAPLPGEEDLYAYLRSHPAEPAGDARWGGPMQEEHGSLEEGVAQGKHVLRHTYTTAYIAHVPLEPRAAVAAWEGSRLTVWTGTQRPFGVRDELATAFGLAVEDVRVIVPDTGSGYGGKHTGEAAREAAHLARAAGAPVKLAWTREEEFTWAYVRPAAVIDISSAVRADGTLTAWEYHNYNAGAPGIYTPYEVPHLRVAFHPSASPLRQGSYRALAATANHFARETHMDELASATGLDPLAFRLYNLRDERLRAVLQAAAARFGWGTAPLPPGHGAGLAAGTEKGSYVATCAEVAVAPSGAVRVVRVVEAFECGAIVNPDGLRNQVEGAIVQGLGGALFEAVEVEEGTITTASFARYRVPRFSDMPAIETVLLDRKDLPSAGAGETPIVGLAPAVGNAIFAATGLRLRSLPLAPGGVVPATARDHAGRDSVTTPREVPQ
jgi:isoquinoline 1-oxidoreductase